MTQPLPSQVRVVRIYAGTNLSAPRGLRSAVCLRWPPKHPLDSDWYWIDATGLCEDLRGTIVQVGCSIVGGDGALTVPATTIACNGTQAGFRLCRGTPGVPYSVRAHLTFSQGTRVAQDISVQVAALAAVPTPNPTYVTNNQDIVLLGGIPFPTGASS